MTGTPHGTPGAPPFAEPTPLPAERVTPPPFDLDLLAAPVRDFVADVAARTGSPPCVPAMAVTVALGAVIGRHLGLHPRAGDPAVIVPNLWGAVVSDGDAFRDGPALAEALIPLEHLEWRAQEAFVRDEAHYRARKAAYQVALKVWRDRVRLAAQGDEDVNALAALHPPEPRAPAVRRHQTGTGTTANLIRLLGANPGGILLNAGDLAPWVRHRSAPDREGERHFLLRCAEGAGPGFDHDLPGGTSLHCAHPCLSVLGWLTEDARTRLLAPGVEQAGAQDLLSRFVLTLCPGEQRAPADPDRPADRAALDRVVELFERLDARVRRPSEGAGTIPALGFDPEAQGFVDGWRTDRVRRLANVEPAGLAVLLARQGEAMPALALVLHLAETAASGATEGAVSMWAARRAAVWCDQLEAHARRLVPSGVPAEAEGARLLLGRLLAGEIASPFTVRDVYRRHWSRLGNADRAQAAVQVLEHHGYLAAEPVPTTARGGKPTRLYHLNPRAAEAAPGERGQPPLTGAG